MALKFYTILRKESKQIPISWLILTLVEVTRGKLVGMGLFDPFILRRIKGGESPNEKRIGNF